MKKKFNYFDHWVSSGNKRGKNELSIKEAKKRFIGKELTGNTFYILVGDKKNPIYIINYVSFQLITIQKLNKNLEPILKIDYKKLENLDNKKMLLSKISANFYDKNLNQTKNKSIGFVKAEYWTNIIYKIHDFPYYLNINYENNTEDSGFLKEELIKRDLLWKENPEFDDWDWMINDLKMVEKLKIFD